MRKKHRFKEQYSLSFLLFFLSYKHKKEEYKLFQNMDDKQGIFCICCLCFLSVNKVSRFFIALCQTKLYIWTRVQNIIILYILYYNCEMTL